MNFGLSESDVSKICSVFSKYNQIEKVLIYGSRAKGNYKRGSDIDLTILGDGLSYSFQMNVLDELDELLLPYMIDLSIFADIDNIGLQEHIKRVGLVFYERSGVTNENQGGTKQL
ncbi:MAG: nucleotidyltransferase [Burkholderiales bacterium]|jgi:predicted nucleotidyltransferase|nr:nucleotidyltransferase [Burkholderiales bacterium]